VWVQRPICLSREAIDASFTSVHGQSLSVLTLDAPPNRQIDLSKGSSSDYSGQPLLAPLAKKSTLDQRPAEKAGDSQIAVGASKRRELWNVE
jgi:hypothetical protein